MPQLTEEQISQYQEDGVVGPLRITSEDKVRAIKERIESSNDHPSPIYGVPTNRDRHLHIREIFELGTSEPIVGLIKRFLGNDIVLFRSDSFVKIPSLKKDKNISTGGGSQAQGAFETKFEYLDWHYGANFATMAAPSVGRQQTPDDDPTTFFRNIPRCMTIWVALTPSFPENGAVEYWKGSHLKGPFGFVQCEPGTGIGGSDFRMDISPPSSECITFSVNPGEGLLFDNRIVHRSRSNHTTAPRFAIGFRYASSDTLIYDGLSEDPYGLPLDNWGVVPVSGSLINNKLPLFKAELLNH